MKPNFIFFIFFIVFYSYYSEDRLVFLYTHFRHGARAPLDLNDTFYDKLGEKWNNPGELTGVGQRMHYIRGLQNRKKYITQEKFLSETYDPHEIIIFSTDRNRTMISCSSQLQGFFPIKDELGYKLSEEQQDIAYPPIEIDDDIQQQVDELGEAALPYLMTLAPVRMVNDNERKMNVYDIDECTEERDAVKKNNSQNIQEFKDYITKFNGKYANDWNKYFNKTKANFTYKEIHDICDSFLSDYAEGNNMTEFQEKSGLDFDELNEDCFDYFEKLYLYTFYGDSKKTLAHVDSSKLLREMIYYMERRLDADISTEDEDSNLKDFSRPRMVMTSGHDSTVSADIILIINALGLNETELYHFPRYTSQLALEVRTNKASCSKYSDYYVLGIHDDEVLFNVTAHDFINKVEKDLWSEKKVNNFCGFDSSNSSNSSSDDSSEDKKDKAKTAYKVLMSIFICLSAILLATTIFFGYKLSKANQARPPIDQSFNANNPNATTNSTKNFN